MFGRKARAKAQDVLDENARLKGEVAAMAARLAHLEKLSPEERLAEKLLASQFENLFGYSGRPGNGGGQGE